mmetsp:Transcript_81674/g.263606  ORF Transcript_81674/g.263606 Transcript_81674/m.263606 type:complete len:269 (-) Transcript_81674:177-983(-)
MFTCLRGTNPGSCRDLSNDVLVIFGCWLCRTKWVLEEYCHTRRKFPGYRSFGSGHSLGGTVMTELAHLVEEQPDLAFHRVDVFNTGGSPLARSYSGLKVTEYNSHRVQGDLVSRYFRAPGRTLEHPQRPEYHPHSLQQFLPDRSDIDEFLQSAGEILHNAEEWMGNCCLGVGRRVHSSADLLTQGVTDGAGLLSDGAGRLANTVLEGSSAALRQLGSLVGEEDVEEGEQTKVLHVAKGDVAPPDVPPAAKQAPPPPSPLPAPPQFRGQ